MRGFITEVADALYRRYGDDISSLRLVFPNRRAQLFFCDALSSLIHRPLWQPAFVSIGELMERLSGLRGSDRVKLITELYKVYSRVHDESFDTFYFWGDMLLADFDQIDKYLIDADMLFSNIGDLKALEGDHSYLTDDQIRILQVLTTDVPLLTDDVAERADLPIRRVLSALTVLEIDGYATQHGARRFVRTVEIRL